MKKNWRMYYWVSLFFLLLLPAMVAEATEATDALLKTYGATAAQSFSAERGATMWTQQHMQKKLQKPVSCASCHGTNLSRSGEHIRTGKLIEPMARSVNAERLTDVKKIRKWLRRNCRWTWGRECTTQEKGDFLQYILGEKQ